MFGCKGKAQAIPLAIRMPCCGFCAIIRGDGVEILPMGEEEVEVTESEVPGLTGAWCKREMLRQ
jgi:hypothetical protein